MCNDFRFFTPLRCVQNDRMGSGAAFGMTEWGWLRSESEIGRPVGMAAFRMTGEGRCVREWQGRGQLQNGDGCVQNDKGRDAAFRMTGRRGCVRNGREGICVRDGRVNCCAAFGMTY